MLLAEVVQNGEDAGGHSRRGVEILVFNRGVDTGVGGLLYGFINREQAAQGISGIGARFIQAHGQNLLWAVFMWIL